MEKLMTVGDIAELLGTSRAAVYIFLRAAVYRNLKNANRTKMGVVQVKSITGLCNGFCRVQGMNGGLFRLAWLL